MNPSQNCLDLITPSGLVSRLRAEKRHTRARLWRNQHGNCQQDYRLLIALVALSDASRSDGRSDSEPSLRVSVSRAAGFESSRPKRSRLSCRKEPAGKAALLLALQAYFDSISVMNC